MADDRRRVRLEQQLTRGWIAELVDYNSRPPAVVPGSRRFVETSQIAGLFESSFSQNSGVIESPLGLSAYAVSVSKGTYMFVEPAGVIPVQIPGSVVLSWVPASVWTVKSEHAKNDRWSGSVRMGAIMPSDLGTITPMSSVTQFPLSNTYEDLRICWGSVREKIVFPKEIRRMITSFFGSMFNGHVWPFDMPFFDYVKYMAPSGKTGKMTDVQKWAAMKEKLEDLEPVTTISKMWRDAVGDGNHDDDDNEPAF